MDARSTETQDLSPLLASIGPQMTEDEARRIFTLGPDALVFVMMELARRLGQTNSNRVDPATPSAQIPAYSKTPRSRRGKPKGARPGHPGSRRETPVEIDRQEDHTITSCPDCDSPVRERSNPRTRAIEDIPVVSSLSSRGT
jgi:transposase